MNSFSRKIADNIERILEHFEIKMVDNSGSYYGCCPIHGGDSKTACNIYLNSHTGRRPMWICCTKRCEDTFFKSMIGFVRGVLSHKKFQWEKRGDKEVGLWEAINYIKKHFGIDIRDENSVANEDNTDFVKSAELFAKVQPVVEQKTTREKVRSALVIPSQYFVSKNIDPKVLNFFDVGDCNFGEMVDRAVVPIYDETDSKVIGFCGRSYNDKDPIKWKNSKGFPRGRCLYNQYNAFKEGRKRGKLYLVEGPKDVWKMHEAGYPNTVAIFGVKLTDGQQILLEKSGIMNIMVFLDPDEAGDGGYKSIYKDLQRSFNVFEVKNTTGLDPGDMTVAQIQGVLS